jgi:hypothetical protein
MCAHHDRDQESRGYQNLTTVAWSILIMGISLAAVILLWVWFGHIGPSFSSDTLAEQQKTLRKEFGLPAKETVVDPKELLTPPSLRHLDNKNNSTNSTSNGTGSS